jgi:hypothetical protein
MRKLAWVSPGEKCVALAHKEHVKETCLFTATPHRSHREASLSMKERGTLMEVLYERCCGLDVHKKTVVACVMLTSPNGRVQKSVRTFGTTTAEILELRDWIDAQQVSHLALESTGIALRVRSIISWRKGTPSFS